MASSLHLHGFCTPSQLTNPRHQPPRIPATSQATYGPFAGYLTCITKPRQTPSACPASSQALVTSRPVHLLRPKQRKVPSQATSPAALTSWLTSACLATSPLRQASSSKPTHPAPSRYQPLACPLVTSLLSRTLPPCLPHIGHHNSPSSLTTSLLSFTLIHSPFTTHFPSYHPSSRTLHVCCTPAYSPSYYPR